MVSCHVLSAIVVSRLWEQSPTACFQTQAYYFQYSCTVLILEQAVPLTLLYTIILLFLRELKALLLKTIEVKLFPTETSMPAKGNKRPETHLWMKGWRRHSPQISLNQALEHDCWHKAIFLPDFDFASILFDGVLLVLSGLVLAVHLEGPVKRKHRLTLDLH